MNTSQNCCCQCFCPLSEPQSLPASAKDPSILAGQSGPVFHGVTAFFPWVLSHMRLCAPSESGASTSPSPVEVLLSNPTCPQSQTLWGLRLPLPDTLAVKPDMGLRILTPVGELLWYDYFPVCGLPTWWVWDLTLSRLHPSYRLIVASFLWM